MSTSALSLRPCTLDDAGITLALFERAVREVASRDYTPSQIEAWINGIALPAWAAVNARRRMWIAMLDDDPAGFVDLTDNGYLDRLFVSPDHQRCGVASALLATVEQAAWQGGMTRLTTDASLTALPFFEARGFWVTRTRQVERWGGTEEFLDGEAFVGNWSNRPAGLSFPAKQQSTKKQEACYHIQNVEKVFKTFMNPGSVMEKLFFFITDDDNSLKTGKEGGLEDEGEDIEVLELPLSKAPEMMRTGEIIDGKTIMLLQHAALRMAAISLA